MDTPLTMLDALRFWNNISSTALRNLEHDFSPRQMCILLQIYLQEGPHSIKSLSEKLYLPKASVCRAVDTLSQAKLVKRRKAEDDKRNVFVQRTLQGSVYLSSFADIILQTEKNLRNLTNC